MIQPFEFSPTAQYLFKRAYSLTLGPPGTSGPIPALQYGTIVPKGVTPSPIRLKFEISKNLIGTSPNHSKIEIYNLSTESRQNIRKGYLVLLKAGYNTITGTQDNSIAGTIFTGNVFIAKSDRQGPDIITSMECFDGGSAIVLARLDRSYGSGTSIIQILEDCAQAMSVETNYQPDGTSIGTVIGLPVMIYDSFIAQGAVSSTLDKICKPQGLEWSVQDGILNVVPKKSTINQTAVVVSSDTGMIGVPSQNEFFTQFTSLLNPQLVPGTLIQMISENVALNGFYKIRASKFEGDTHDNKWQVACEATLVNELVGTAPTNEGSNFNTAGLA